MIEIDSAGNAYVDVANLRITLVLGHKRRDDKNWAGCDVLRFQAYADSTSKRIMPGPEYPIGKTSDALKLFEAVHTLLVI